MSELGDPRHLPALAAALQALLVPGPAEALCERVLGAYAGPAGLDFAAFLEPSGPCFGPRGVWQRERPSSRPEDLRLPPRWLDVLGEGRCLVLPAGEPAPPELKPLRLFGAPALLAAPARAEGLAGVLLLASNAPRFQWTEAHEQAAAALAAALTLALARADQASRVLDQLPQRIAWKDSALRYRGCNRAFARAAGLTGAQLLGRDDLELVIDPELGERGESARRREAEVLAAGRPQLGRVEATPLAPGREQLHLVSRIPMTDGSGGLLVVSEDLTERIQVAAALRHAERGASLARLTAALQADLEPVLGELARTCEGRAQALAREGADLIRQLGAFARRQLLDPIDLVPAALIARMGRVLARIFGDHVALDLPGEGLRCAVRADPRQLEQLVVALARHLAPQLAPGARVAIEVSPQTLRTERSLAHGLPAGEYVRIALTAAPLAADASPDEASARLVLAQAAARAAGGALRLARDALGLLVEIHLPRVFSLPRAPEVGPPPDLRGVESILLVEDDLPLSAAVCAALELLGYRVHPVVDLTDALEALRQLAAGPPALALVSTELPGGSVAELGRALQKAQPELRILGLSRQASGEGVVAAGSFEHLAARVRQALDARPT